MHIVPWRKKVPLTPSVTAIFGMALICSLALLAACSHNVTEADSPASAEECNGESTCVVTISTPQPILVCMQKIRTGAVLAEIDSNEHGSWTTDVPPVDPVYVSKAPKCDTHSPLQMSPSILFFGSVAKQQHPYQFRVTGSNQNSNDAPSLVLHRMPDGHKEVWWYYLTHTRVNPDGSTTQPDPLNQPDVKVMFLGCDNNNAHCPL